MNSEMAYYRDVCNSGADIFNKPSNFFFKMEMTLC